MRFRFSSLGNVSVFPYLEEENEWHPLVVCVQRPLLPLGVGFNPGVREVLALLALPAWNKEKTNFPINYFLNKFKYEKQLQLLFNKENSN